MSTITSILSVGALTRDDAHQGWRHYYWIMFAVRGVTILGLLFGYRPPKRHARCETLRIWDKIRQLDLVGFFLLTTGLSLFLVGMGLGGVLYAWDDAPVLGTLVTGIVTLLAFALHEWKGTTHGILHHDLFRGPPEYVRTYVGCILLIFIEGIMLFAFVIFYPQLQVYFLPFCDTRSD
ncbi:uncharacterized protein MYCFIDRAFT_209540 [Pseudocercospora fijiensis CIRAD86]|uniref:Uncharacterized protein n=1 Tax=Pseudocercospora fijiensis (strain CIRAD86) TaxID=383855 RepID=N1Q9J6_PSEFD|nr:uncharacterized protein MYCFIDRAFT_209540 [Pseudocercospora fijiensis CIRAD86]EME87563.1 hypothetical protein MYCFIDRAFT_209540 [Pseudocercospora fijiensis CIRAD86]